MNLKMNQMKKNLSLLIDYLIRNSDAAHPVWNVEKRGAMGGSRWNYVDGFMIMAFLELYRVTGEEKYLRFSDEFIGSYLQDDGSIRTFDKSAKCLDDVCGARTFFSLLQFTENQKYQNGIESIYHFLRSFPRTKEGNFWHKEIYPYQVWLDGVFMAMPFYMEYETKYNHMRNYYDIYSQLKALRKNMRDAATGLYFHGYDESRSMGWADPETGCSKSFWLRSIGWLVIGLVDTLEHMDEQIYYEYRCIGSMLKDLLDSLLPYQDESGMFYQIIDRPNDKGNYFETSGTCMVAYGMMKAVRLRLLPERYRQYGEKAFYGTAEKYFTVKNNIPTLSGICLVGGLGGPEARNGTPDYYYGELVTENDGKGLAPFLLAYSEILRKNSADSRILHEHKEIEKS